MSLPVSSQFACCCVWNILLLGDDLLNFAADPDALMARLDKLQPQLIFQRKSTQSMVLAPDDENTESGI